MLNEKERNMLARLRTKLQEMEQTVQVYHEELKQGKFRPRNGERWERTIEKYMVTSASLLGKSNEELLQGFFELARMNSLAKEAKLIGEDTGRSS